MTKEEVMRMARECFADPDGSLVVLTPELTAFADLVIREVIKDGWRQCAKGQRTTQFCGMAEKAREEEREECAKVCEELEEDDASPLFVSQQCANAIRARKSQ